MRTNDCTPAITAGRLAKAEGFFAAAEALGAIVDEYDSVGRNTAGIDACDVLCCRTLGRHAQGPNHADAVELVDKVDKEAARHLATLLKHKTRVGYGARPLSNADSKKIQRAAGYLIDAMSPSCEFASGCW